MEPVPGHNMKNQRSNSCWKKYSHLGLTHQTELPPMEGIYENRKLKKSRRKPCYLNRAAFFTYQFDQS